MVLNHFFHHLFVQNKLLQLNNEHKLYFYQQDIFLNIFSNFLMLHHKNLLHIKNKLDIIAALAAS